VISRDWQNLVMAEPFTHAYSAQWRDMDFNQHLANSAYLDYAANTRFLFLESVGFTAATFAERQFGPVILDDRLTYKREIRLLQPFTVDYQMAAATVDGRRFKVRNQFMTAEHGLCATVDSIGVWFDLASRRPIRPPDDLQAAFSQLAHTDDFEDWN